MLVRHFKCDIIFFFEKLDNSDSNKYRQLRRIQSLLYEFDRLQVTSMEYAYLKLISIFKPSNNHGKNSN